MRSSKIAMILVLAVMMVFVLSLGVSAADTEYTYVQDDPDLATKFKIDKFIADGFESNDLYIGTTKAYLESIGVEADGATSVFQDGLAWSPADILITNGKVGIVLCVGSADPWGYPSGSIMDAGRVNLPETAIAEDGTVDWTQAEFGKDTVLTCQLLFNGWDAWAPVNSGMASFRIVYYDFDAKEVVDKDDPNGKIAVEVFRKYQVPSYGTPRDFDVYSYYTIDPGAEYAYMYDTLTNVGNAAVTSDVANCISISNKGGDGLVMNSVNALTASATYNFETNAAGEPTRQFTTTLVTPGENMSSDGTAHELGYIGFKYYGVYLVTAGGYREHSFNDPSYEPGESRTYESYLLISDECSWQDTYNFYAAYKDMETFTVSGKVTTADGSAAKYPTIVISRGRDQFGWVMGDENGNYSVTLPVMAESDTYTFSVEMDGAAPSAASDPIVAADGDQTRDLIAGADKVPVTFKFVDSETGDPVWGRVQVNGASAVTAFNGVSYFLSDNGEGHTEENGSYGPGTVEEVEKGVVTAWVAPGDYNITVYGEGYNFYSKLEAADGMTINSSASGVGTCTGNTDSKNEWVIEVTFDNETPENWYTIDNHHHGLRMDAFTKAETVAKAQVTAGLDVLTLDDHEFVLDNWPVYQWGQVMDIVGYMPSEEVTASWAHFDIMPLTFDCYEQHLDRNQENHVVNTNQSLEDIIAQGHEFGASIGAMHPTDNYGMLKADTDNAVPGGLIDEFDGLETQFSSAHTNEAMAYWTAWLENGSHRNVEVERPHYIWASTDIHDSGNNATSGSNRSYVFLENGDAISEEDFDAFGVEFARSEALGHSFNSNGVLVIPATEGLMYGETYWTDEDGNITLKFDLSSLYDLKTLYVFSNNGTGTGFGGFNNLYETYDLSEYASNEIDDFTIEIEGFEGKNWVAIGVEDTKGKKAFTNPIWINGADVETETITAVEFQTEPTLPAALAAGEEITAPTSAGILITTPWSARMVEDWALVGDEYGDVAVDGRIYTYRLTYEAPEGYVFDQALGEAEGWTVNAEGTVLTYTVEVSCGDEAEAFVDTEDLWMEEAVTYLKARGIANGVGNDLFAPYGNITRAEFVALIVRALDLEDNGNEAVVFADAEDIPAWFVEEIALASAHGIILGDTEGNCNPNDNIKREDMFLIAYRALDLQGMIPATIAERDITFTDIADLSAYAAEEVNALVDLGLIDGNDDGTLNPLGTATRGEGAQFLYNILTWK